MEDSPSSLRKFRKDWDVAVTNNDYKKLFALSLKLTKKILPSLTNEGVPSTKDIKIDIDGLIDLIEGLNKTIPLIIEKDYEKQQAIQSITMSLYDSLFSEPPESMASGNETQIGSEREEGDGKNNINVEYGDTGEVEEVKALKNKIPTIRAPRDDKPHILVEKIRSQFEAAIPSFLKLFKTLSAIMLVNRDIEANNGEISSIEDPESRYQKGFYLLAELVLYLLDVFPDTVAHIAQDILYYYEHGFIPADIFDRFVRKALDVLPYPMIFTLATALQEYLEYGDKLFADPSILKEMEIIIGIFSEYAQFYPNYFGAHIPLYYGILLKLYNVPEIANSAIELLLFYARHADERLNSLLFELYEFLLNALRGKAKLSEEIKKRLIRLIQAIWDNGPDYVMEEWAEDPEIFEEKKSLVLRGLDLKDLEFKELSYELLIGIYMVEVENTLAEFEPERNPEQNSTEGELGNGISQREGVKNVGYKLKKNQKRKLFSPIREICDKIIDDNIYSTYLYLQMVQDTFSVLERIEGKSSELEKRRRYFMDEKKLNRKESYFSLLREFRKSLKF